VGAVMPKALLAVSLLCFLKQGFMRTRAYAMVENIEKDVREAGQVLGRQVEIIKLDQTRR
jgi:hypothetical protein